MRDIWRIVWVGDGVQRENGPGADERGPRRASGDISEEFGTRTVINLTAMDTGLRDYHFGLPPYASDTHTVWAYIRARDDAYEERSPTDIIEMTLG